MKSINNVYKQIWMVKELPINTKCTRCIKTLQNLAGIDAYKNIHLIQACIYHDKCKTSPKWH